MTGIALGAEFSPLAFEQVTVTTSAQALTALSTKPPAARHVQLYPEDYLRYRCDGSDPEQGVGLILGADLHVFENQLAMIDNMILISGTGGNVTLNVHWYR